MTDPADPSKVHHVEAGDRMSKIAFQHGYANFKKVWDDGANAALKKKRHDKPEILMPGDDVVLPEKTPPSAAAPDKKTKQFIQETTSPEIRLHVTAGGKPIPDGKEFEVVIDVPPYSKADPYKGTGTFKGGVAKFFVHPLATTLVLRIKDPAFELKLLVGHLRPIDEQGGVEQRLSDLGYFCPIPPAAPPPDPPTEAQKKVLEENDGLKKHAVGRFQAAKGLLGRGRKTGVADADTVAALGKAHEPG